MSLPTCSSPFSSTLTDIRRRQLPQRQRETKYVSVIIPSLTIVDQTPSEGDVRATCQTDARADKMDGSFCASFSYAAGCYLSSNTAPSRRRDFAEVLQAGVVHAKFLICGILSDQNFAKW